MIGAVSFLANLFTATFSFYCRSHAVCLLKIERLSVPRRYGGDNRLGINVMHDLNSSLIRSDRRFNFPFFVPSLFGLIDSVIIASEL